MIIQGRAAQDKPHSADQVQEPFTALQDDGEPGGSLIDRDFFKKQCEVMSLPSLSASERAWSCLHV